MVHNLWVWPCQSKKHICISFATGFSHTQINICPVKLIELVKVWPRLVLDNLDHHISLRLYLKMHDHHKC